MSLQDTTFDDLAQITSSKRIYESDYVNAGVPFFRSKEIIELSKGKAYSTALFISEGKFKEIEYRFGAPEAGDLLITSVGTLGVSYVVKKSDEFYFKDGNLIWFRRFRDKHSSIFLSYWMQSSFGRRCILTTAIGTSQPALTIAGLKRLKVPYPPPSEQQKIAAILAAYDDLIENNRQRIALLEKMAEEIYREWFVRLRFPGHEHTPVHKGVPEGWELDRVDSLGQVATGKTPSTKNIKYYGGRILFIKTPDMHGNMFVTETEESLTQEGLESQPSQIIRENAICVSCIGTGGVVSIATAQCSTNQQINSLTLNNRTDLEWAFYTLRALASSNTK